MSKDSPNHLLFLDLDAAHYWGMDPETFWSKPPYVQAAMRAYAGAISDMRAVEEYIYKSKRRLQQAQAQANKGKGKGK